MLAGDAVRQGLAAIDAGEVKALLQRLLTCDTSNPPGHEAQAAAVIEEYAQANGLECRRVAADRDRPNLVVRLRGRGTGPSLGFLGHLDVVPARRQEWSMEPFAGIEKDGAIWGRGAVDMKCQVAATTVALAALARSGFEPNGDLMLLFMADEEVGAAGVGAPFFVEAPDAPRPDYLIGEGAGERLPTPNGPIYLLDHGVKASSQATLTVRGVPGDASLAGAGASALTELARLLLRLERREAAIRVTKEVRPLLEAAAGSEGSPEEQLRRAEAASPAVAQLLTSLLTTVVHPTVARAEGPANAVPGRAEVTLQCIVLPGTTAEQLRAELEEALGPGDYELEITEPKGGLLSALGTPLHAAIENFLADHDPEARLVPSLGYGFADCHQFREAFGTVVYGFIPFRHADPETNFGTKHGPDEHVLIEDLEFQVLAAIEIARAVGETVH
jgi:acetylornithine deacetylase/succinyl-diaminopimelate desuccinylase-like protein